MLGIYDTVHTQFLGGSVNIFDFREGVIKDYSTYVTSFVHIRDREIREYVEQHLSDGTFWPDPLVQLNPNFTSGGSIQGLVDAGTLHLRCAELFTTPPQNQVPIHLHQHQKAAIELAKQGLSYVVTTGTGSGKSLTYIIPIVDHVLRQGSGRGIKAIIVYPMNALANSQSEELEKFIGSSSEVRFARYTGQESAEKKKEIIANPPDILLTNYMMLELILTRMDEARLVESAKDLAFLVFDELHTYRGRQGADVSLLIRRLRERLGTTQTICVGTSATMSSSGSFSERQAAVAGVAAKIFGVPIAANQVIGETLERVTKGAVGVLDLKQALGVDVPVSFEAFIVDPVASWLEQQIGLIERYGRLERNAPKAISGKSGLASDLSKLTGINQGQCKDMIEQRLLSGVKLRHPVTGRAVFAFRLHQFISKASTVYAPLTMMVKRLEHLTLQGQIFAPNSDRGLRLYPLEFCRNCGQEYYSVRRTTLDSQDIFIARGGILSEEGSSDDGYLFLGDWSDDVSRLPEHWLEEKNGQLKIKSSHKRDVPEILHVNGKGEVGTGLQAAFVSANFKFCLCCGVSYVGRTGKMTKLATLSSEGRSTATTLISMAAVQGLRRSDLAPKARKLLSFTDNRQDASLQAGHFNDFVFVASLRAGLAAALKHQSLEHDTIAKAVFEAMHLELNDFASDTNVRFRERDRTIKVAQDVIGYSLYTDLAEGKRLTLPNLEAVDLVRFSYPYLEEICQSEEFWVGLHPALSHPRANVEQYRYEAARALLDWMRQHLAIKIPYLEREWLSRMVLNMGLLREDSPLYIPSDEQNKLDAATVVALGSRTSQNYDVLNLGPMSALGKYLMRPSTLNWGSPLKQLDAQQLLEGLFKALSEFIEAVDDNAYQLKGTAFLWHAGEGTEAFRDTLRVIRPENSDPPRVNPFFLGLYRQPSSHFKNLQSAEHTAQIRSDEREKREHQFREGNLPAMFCSPTMELGVDIADLNVVHMRNVPPTPANYAQRSGRAGRGGEPALVLTYATTGNNHDQYFFRRPALMVGGAVTTPRLDLSNQTLLRSHLHALWLAETGQNLPSSLADILDMNGEEPSLELLEEIKKVFASPLVWQRSVTRARQLLEHLGVDLRSTTWFNDSWLEQTLQAAPFEFNKACDRWRELYKSALSQLNLNNGVLADASKRHWHETAKRLHSEANIQLALLRNDEGEQSDFYTYRYLASEGFLPGYNFARLPLSAYIPGRRVGKQASDSYLSRPRFLAISEFGPNAIVYHNGAKYEAHKVIVPARGETSELPVTSAQRCEQCGYLHFGTPSDLCQNCHTKLPPPQVNLFRMTSVATRRRERIGSDEEERQRIGFEVQSGLRFATRGGQSDRLEMLARTDQTDCLRLTYGDGATLWRINYGWRNRSNKNELGFLFDPETSQWLTQKKLEEKQRDAVKREVHVQRVIPYVADTRNVLLIEPPTASDANTMVTLMSALKNAIQLVYQLEDSELAAEVLPNAQQPRQILLFEASEGGAGVLQDLLLQAGKLPEVARRALELLHFEPSTGEDEGHALTTGEPCVAACYDCLMTYGNQSHHEKLDRFKVKNLFLALTQCHLESAQPSSSSPLDDLQRACLRQLERDWLDMLVQKRLRLPSQAQARLEQYDATVDFLYHQEASVIFIGQPQPALVDKLDLAGFTVIVFAEDPNSWAGVLQRHAFLFGDGHV